MNMSLDEEIKHHEEIVKHYKQIMERYKNCSTDPDIEGYRHYAEYTHQYAEWLKELKKYKEKNTPKLVIYSGDGYADGYLVYAECPNCGREFENGDDDWNMPYCCACGQALKWEVEE